MVQHSGCFRLNLQCREVGDSQSHESLGDQTGTRPDLQYRSIEVHVFEDPRQCLTDHFFTPLLRGAIALVKAVHADDYTTATRWNV